MQAKNRIPPRLLTDPEQPKTYEIKIGLPRGNWAEMRFSQKELAQAEYNRIKSASIFGGQWIERIELNETK